MEAGPITPRRQLRRLVALAAASTMVVSVAGCAQIPTEGPVQRGDQVQGAVDAPPVRVVPRGPVPGQSATAVVKGFLDASASFEDDHAVARRFLTPRAEKAWNPDAGVTVIDDNPQRVVSFEGGNVVDLSAQQTARITSDGAFIPRGGVDFSQPFPMKKEGDTWRIARAPRGLILDRIEVSLSFRAFDVFFMSPEHVGTCQGTGAPTSCSFLVADPVYLPVEQPGSATSLVQTLLNGPTTWLGPAVETKIPAGTQLVVNSVPVANGIAKVDLTSEFLAADDATLEQAAAQITSTLLERSSLVTGVAITVEGEPLDLPSAPAVFTADTWDQFDPDTLSPALGPLFVRSGAVWRYNDGAPVKAQGPLGKGNLNVKEPSQSWDGGTVTALNQSSSKLLVSHPFVSSAVEKRSGRAMLPATIDGTGRMWSLDIGGKRPQLSVTDGNRWRPAAIQAPRGTIESFRVSADGTRMAIVVRPGSQNRARKGTGPGRLMVGRVVRGADRLRVEAFRPVELTLSKVRDAFWVDATTLVVMGTTSNSAVEPMLVNINRTVTSPSNDVLLGVRDVVGAPGFPLLADTLKSSGIWETRGSGWEKIVNKGRDPAYPG